MMNIQKELQQFSAGEADMRFNNVDVAPNCAIPRFSIKEYALYPQRNTHYTLLHHDRQNILIEKSKFEMASEDIETMYRLITQ